MIEKPKTYEMLVQVQAEHLDEMNHVNNVQYLQWVQDVAKAHWESAAEQHWLNDFVWVALSHHIEYKKPAYLNDKLSIRTHVHKFSGVKSHRLVRIFNAANDSLLVQASTEWCMLGRKDHRPKRILSEMIKAFSEQ